MKDFLKKRGVDYTNYRFGASLVQMASMLEKILLQQILSWVSETSLGKLQYILSSTPEGGVGLFDSSNYRAGHKREGFHSTFR